MKHIIAIAITLVLLLASTALAEGGMTGSWTFPENVEMTDEMKTVFEKGIDGLLGVSYTPVACLGTQVVAGTNYCFLCKARVVIPDADDYYALVYLYQDPAGDVSVLNIVPMDIVEMGMEGLEDDGEFSSGDAYDPT